MVKKRADVGEDVEDIEVEVKVEVDEAEELAVVEGVVVLAAPGRVGGSAPFLPAGPLTGVPRVPADADAEGPGTAAASSASTRSGRPSVQANTAERIAFISKVRIRQ